MKIDVRPLRDGESLSFSHALDLSTLDFHGRISFSEPVTVEGTVVKRGGVLSLTAQWNALVSFRCDRCDEPFSRELTQTVECFLTEGGADDRDNYAPLEGGFCELDDIIIPSVVLSIESKNLCSEDCVSNWITEEV